MFAVDVTKGGTHVEIHYLSLKMCHVTYHIMPATSLNEMLRFGATVSLILTLCFVFLLAFVLSVFSCKHFYTQLQLLHCTTGNGWTDELEVGKSKRN